MRTLSAKEKMRAKQLYELNDKNRINILDWFAQLVKNELSGVFLSKTVDYVYIFGDSDTIDEMFGDILSDICLLEELQKEGVLYFMTNERQNAFLGRGRKYTVGEDSSSKFSFELGDVIVNEFGCEWQLKNENIVNGKSLEYVIACKINAIFNTTVFLTPAFKELLSVGFESVEIRSYKNDVRNAKRSRNIAWITLLLSIVVQPAMTFFDNKYSKIQIKDEQYNCVIKKIESIVVYLKIISFLL